MKKRALLLAGALALSSTAPVWAMDYGTMLSETCIGCHGPNGASTGPAIPSIGGLAEDTLTDTMMQYKSGDRKGTIMNRIAKAYTEEEFGLMAKYFSAQKFVPAEQKVDAAKAAKGKKHHKEYCEKCHEDKGTKDIDGSSILAGQWLPYLQYNLADFHAGDREMAKKMAKRMKKMVKENGEQSLDDIAHFYAGNK